jgi:hypothetical protein
MTIRQLKPGDPLPSGEPCRYPSSHGYVRCRWKVGTRQYVEAYEHRIDWQRGSVVTADHVHHRNHTPSDNSPENLVPLSVEAHGELHRRIDWNAVVELYLGGMTTTQVAKRLQCDPGQVSRILSRQGVTVRTNRDYAARRRAADVRAAYFASSSCRGVGVILGVSKAVAARMMRDEGLPPFPVGRHPGS